MMEVNILIRAIPVVTGLYCLLLLLVYFQQKAHGGGLTAYLRKALFWSPRLALVLFALFTGLFSLDLSGEDYRIGELLALLIVHLVPAFVLLLILAITWRWEWIGGIAFLGAAAFGLFSSLYNQEWSWIVSFVVPLALIGVLY